MAKKRVYELAREFGIESKVLVTKLQAIGVDVASHQSTVDGEQIDLAREKFGSGDAAVTKKAKAKPTVILRRRKKAAQEPEGNAPEEEVAAEEAPKTVVRRKVAAKAEPVEKPEEPKVEEAAPEKAVVEPEETKVEEPVEAVEAPEKSVEADAEATTEEAAVEATTEETVVEAAPEKKATARKVPKKPKGATIVRRATPEEVESLEQSREKQRRPFRKEDSRGTRITGLGFGSRDGQKSQEEDPNAAVGTDAPKRRGRGPVPASATAAAKKKEEEERAKPVSAKQKRANAALTMRALLQDVDNTAAEEDGRVQVTRRPRTSRKVYTPTATQRRRDLKRRKNLKKTEVTVPRAAYRVVKMIEETITVSELAKQLHVKAAELIKKLMTQGVMATINQEVDMDTATLIAGEYDFEIQNEIVTIDDILTAKPDAAAEESDELEGESRPPVVTIMGHVDHGKTSILDAIRESNVVSGEAGGITQHIGAYSIDYNGKKIAFLDTPGHEAFSAMRARGAECTDIVILVVAADDGVMPQTIEAISHSKDAGVPIIVAINKMDRPNINIDRVTSELAEHGLQPEDWGGDCQFIKCSALEKTGLDELVDAILLQSEMMELKADAEGSAEGIVVEAHLDKGRGPVATVMVQKGMMKPGEFLVAGTEIGRVRAMTNHKGEAVEFAGPSTPVEVTGLSGVPMAGDRVNVVEDERTARDAAQWRHQQVLASRSSTSSASTLDDLLGRIQADELIDVPFIIKADTQGSVEAVCDSILKLNTDKVSNKIIHRAVGGITESDVTLASASDAIVVAFNVRAVRGMEDEAEKQGVLVNYYSIIYDLTDAVKAIMEGRLPPIVSEIFLGRAEVKQSIGVPKIGTIAGSAVTEGKIQRNSSCRLIRDEIVIYEGKLGSLRRFKDDVKEVMSGYECGIGIEGYNDIKIGDVIEAFVLEETAATL